MRHITRTHGVNVSWLHDLYAKGMFQMMYTRTESQCADIFTKTFRDAAKWSEAVRMIGAAPPGSAVHPPPTPGRRPDPPAKAESPTRPDAKGGALAVDRPVDL